MIGIELICLTPNKMEFIYDMQRNIMPPIHHNEICYSGSPGIDGECDIDTDDERNHNDDRSESNNFIVKHAKYKSINQHLKRINVTLALSLTIPIHLRYSLPISYKKFHDRHDYGNGISSNRAINKNDDINDDSNDSSSINRDDIVFIEKTLYKRIPLPLPYLFFNRANKLIKNNERYVSINKVIKREDHNHYNTKKFTNVYYDTTRLNRTGNYDDYYRLFINHYHYIDIDYSKVNFLENINYNDNSMYIHIPIGNSDNLIIIFTSTICIIVFTSLYLFFIIYNIKRVT